MRRDALALALLPASALFGLVSAIRRACYRWRLLPSFDAGVPVVVVGNLVAGGSGKTPLVLHLAELLGSIGWSPGIVLRGYGGSADSARAVTSDSDPAEVGDESVLLARRSDCPVWISCDRIAAARGLREAEPSCNLIIADDGLQHYRLRRDLEIAVVDRRGFGNGFLIPAGPLRESPARLRSVDAVVSHEAPLAGYSMRLSGATLVRLGGAGETQALASFAGRNVHAIAGIGDPGRFFELLRTAGLLVQAHPFPDHHPFTPRDIEFDDEHPVLMTEKDAVKFHAPARECWVLPVAAELDPAFDRWLIEKLRGKMRQIAREPRRCLPGP